MKKCISILLVLVMIMSLCACGSREIDVIADIWKLASSG